MDGKFGAVHRAVAILDKFHQHLPSRAKDQFEAVPQRSGDFTIQNLRQITYKYK